MQLQNFVLPIYKQMDKPVGKVGFMVDNKPGADASIIRFAKKIDAHFICMSTRGGGILDKFMGTNAEMLINTSSVPVFIVPHGYRSKPIRSFLYASDLERVESELKSVKNISDTIDASVSICHYESAMDSIRKRTSTFLIWR